MDVLREALMDSYGIALNDAKTIHNKMVEGKYPERQAYNKDGLLVTFPTPQHKQRAIQRGTHFEQNPVSANQNVFGGEKGQAPATTPPATPPTQPAATPPAPQETPATTPPAGQGKAAPSQLPSSDTKPETPAAPAGQSSPSSLPTSEHPPTTPAAPPATPPTTPAAPAQPVPPATAPVSDPPPNFNEPKPARERSAEAAVVKQIMRGDETDPSVLTPSITEKQQLREVLEFAKRMGYREAIQIISKMI